LALTHPDLRRAAEACFEAALDALDRLDVDDTTATACGNYLDRYVARGRCPGDDWM
jgi:glutamate--cysteine ligase